MNKQPPGLRVSGYGQGIAAQQQQSYQYQFLGGASPWEAVAEAVQVPSEHKNIIIESKSIDKSARENKKNQNKEKRK